MMPLPQLWGALFFFMLICLGLGTEYVLVETAATALIDEYPEVGQRPLGLLILSEGVIPGWTHCLTWPHCMVKVIIVYSSMCHVP